MCVYIYIYICIHESPKDMHSEGSHIWLAGLNYDIIAWYKVRNVPLRGIKNYNMYLCTLLQIEVQIWSTCTSQYSQLIQPSTTKNQFSEPVTLLKKTHSTTTTTTTTTNITTSTTTNTTTTRSALKRYHGDEVCCWPARWSVLGRAAEQLPALAGRSQ